MPTADVAIAADDGHVVRGTHRAPHEVVATLLLVHGITGTRHERGYYDAVASSLLERGVASLAIDYRGHGESLLRMDEMTLSGVMLDIAASWQFLIDAHPDPQTRIITGCSFGGGVSLLHGFAAHADHILLTMPVLTYVDDVTRVNPSWHDDVANGYIGYEDARLSPLLASDFHFFDALIEQAEYTRPYTILHGEADSDVPFQASIDFCNAHAGGTLIGIPDVDHGWSAPGDLVRATKQSEVNQQVAIAKTLEIFDDWLTKQ